MQVATLWYRRLDHGFGSEKSAGQNIDPVSNPWGGEMVDRLPRHLIDFDKWVEQSRDDQFYNGRWPSEDPEQLPGVLTIELPVEWPVLKQTQVGNELFTLVDDGSW